MIKKVTIVAVVIFLQTSCSPSVEKSSNTFTPTRIEFKNNDSFAGSGSLTFSSTITSTSPITEIALWVEVNGEYLKYHTQYLNTLSDDELISNGDFEDYNSTVIGEVASFFNISESLNSTSSALIDTGRTGSAQKISISAADSLGVSISQNVPLFVGDEYLWTFWYKTDGEHSVYADIHGNELGGADNSKVIPGTNGSWRQATLMYKYTDSQISPKVRIISKDIQNIWVDDSSLKRVIEKSEALTVDFEHTVSLPAGTYSWYLVATDLEGSSKSQVLTTTH